MFFDHLVLNVADVERSLAWYRDVLGMEPVRLEEWRRGEVPFVSVRVNESTIIDLIERARTGENADHIALVVDDDTYERFLSDPPVPIVRGPVSLFGAQGSGEGFYLRDPDGNGVELRRYPPAG